MSVCAKCSQVILMGHCGCHGDRIPAATTAALKAERERVARRCAEIADAGARLKAVPEWIAQRIREEFGL